MYHRIYLSFVQQGITRDIQFVIRLNRTVPLFPCVSFILSATKRYKRRAHDRHSLSHFSPASHHYPLTSLASFTIQFFKSTVAVLAFAATSVLEARECKGTSSPAFITWTGVLTFARSVL